MPKVSVIIPAYNCAKFVDGTIISVLKQDFSDYEMVIIDDGSTDNTYEAISRFSDRRIKYIHQINQGVGAARNTGIQKSNGEYLCFLDCDDIFLANSISKRVAFLDKYKEVMLVFSDHSREYDKGYPISNYLRKYDFVNFCKDEIVKS
ncbi:MAG: glycosyltransferase family 2 protein, partial [Candidatus Omnitrophica bacterium]|nr:glycosyltransferase family 2 protein [Candidatus Omnitrophota bacterium]